MATNRRQRGSSSARPWRLCLIRTYTDRSGVEKSHFIGIGSLFHNEGGFTADNAGIYVDVRRGDRLALFPPNEGEHET